MQIWADVRFYFQVDIFMFWLALGFIIFWAALWMLHALSITYGTWRLHRKKGGSNSKSYEGSGLGDEGGHPSGVSILKPLVGSGDPNLYSNLETFFTQNYPKFELLFCVHSEDDPALAIVETLIKTYPSIDCRIFKGGQDVGINPKINNMMPGYANAKYELILISDSGIRMKDDTLWDMVNHMTDKVGMITQLPFVCDRSATFANTLEKVFFGGYHARMYLAADSAAVLCPTGMSSLIRKRVLDECGGLQNYGKYIAEDYFMGESVVKKGWKCTISSQPAWQNHGCATVKSFHLRVARWAKLRIAMLPHMIVLEPIQDCVVNGLLASWALNYLFQWNSLILFLIHMLIWMLLDYVLLCIVQNGPLPFGRFEFAVSWLYRELSAFPTFVYALLRPEIQWRSSGTYTLEWGGLAVKVRDGAGNKITAAAASNPAIMSSRKDDPAQSGINGSAQKGSLSPTLSPLRPPAYSAAHQHSVSTAQQEHQQRRNPTICSTTINLLSFNLNTEGAAGGGPLLLLSSLSPTTTKDKSIDVGDEKDFSGTITSPLSMRATQLSGLGSRRMISTPDFKEGHQKTFGGCPIFVDDGHTVNITAPYDNDGGTTTTTHQHILPGRQSFQTHSRSASLRSQSEII